MSSSVAARRLVVPVALLALGAACLTTVPEPDCLRDGLCECRRKADCPPEKECVDGHCFLVPDAGAPGDFGTACVSDADCHVGPCLPPGPGNGRVCTQRCNEDGGTACPRGWQCKSRLEGPGFVCTPPYRNLCLGCAQDSDCNAAGDRCLSLGGGAERACGQDCALSPCPAGFTCRAVRLDAGSAQQCVPDAESCACGPATVGVLRSCSKDGGGATCFGFARCQEDGGFSACDAPSVSPERCNGLDDDCDGLVDGADPSLDTSGLSGFPACVKGTTCTGRWFCAAQADGGAEFRCSAPDPIPERCNGLDEDCDGQIDEGLRDATGRYTSPFACGSCNTDCSVALLHLAKDGGVVLADAVACEDRSGQLTCVPLRCEKGFFPSPPGAPQTCEPAITSQCRTCSASSECRVPGDECVQVGMDVGRACLQACEVDAPYVGCTGRLGEQGCCPSGAACQQVGARRLCVPQVSSCQCTPATAGLTRSCFVTDGGATCVGLQQCQGTGAFSTCDLSTTAIELCDGRDNDCDGQTDETFVNTRGTGTYDSDTTCGSCTNNCLVRWNQSIQKAIGGCVPRSLGPRCEIVRCVNESAVAGRDCRADTDCVAGQRCDPQLHQCRQACTAGGTCADGRRCVGGVCVASCGSDAACAALGLAGATCTAGQCQVPVQYVDLDLDDTNGCECARLPGVDEPDVSASYPTAGQVYVDRDCDGVDGDAETALFVSAASTSSQGTRTAPFRTIAQALAAFVPGRHSAILVAQGSYVEQVVLRSGASIHGGYSADFLRRDVVTFPTLIEAPEPTAGGANGAVNAVGLSARTVFAGFTVRGYDVNTRPSAGQQARSSYAVYVSNSPGLVLQNNHLVGGRAGDAVTGAAGPAGGNGQSGADGLIARECASASCAGETQQGGVPGGNTACNGTVGSPGAGSTIARDPQDYGTGGFNGRGGFNGVYAHSAPSQSAFCKYDCTVPSEGLAGGPAQNGRDGTVGPRTGAGGRPMPTLAAGEWAPLASLAGSAGSAAAGGGGGGAGGCVRNMNPGNCTVGRLVGDLGGTGGGGGGGGCGGGGGGRGGAGGASFGLLIASGTVAGVRGNLVTLGFGGNGGNGGAGGAGGLGGQGGRGGPNSTSAWCAGQGGPGGRGGNGGPGSGGGGGAGGIAVGIGGVALDVGAALLVNRFNPIPLNAAGRAGVGGTSPAGVGAGGGDGQVGTASLAVSF